MSGKATGTQAQDVRNRIEDDTISEAEELGIDVDEVIEAKVEELDYSADTVARFAGNDLRERIEAEQSEEIIGIVVGTRDAYDRNWPRRFSIVRSSGEHVEVSNWGGDLPSEDGTDVRVPTKNAILKLRCDYDEEYNSYEARRLDSIKQITTSKTKENLNKIAVWGDDLTQQDEYSIVCVRGTIRNIEPQTLFEDGEPAGDGPVLMRDERNEEQPHMEINLERDGKTQVRANLSRQSYGELFVDLPDMPALAEDACELHDEPQDQAAFLSDGLKGIDVFVVGNVNSYNVHRGDDGGRTDYVDIAATAVLATDPGIGEFAGESEEEEEEEGEKDATDDEAEGDAEEETDRAADEAEEGSPDESAVNEASGKIEQYCDLTGTDPEMMDVEMVRDKLDMEGIPDVAIRVALEEDEEDEAGGEDLTDQEGYEDVSEFEPLFKGDSYNCPGEDCLVQKSSAGSLAGHVAQAHDIGDMDPKEWLREQM